MLNYEFFFVSLPSNKRKYHGKIKSDKNRFGYALQEGRRRSQMITKDEIQELLHSTETYRVERTTSTGDMDKFQEAICAFANDLPNSRKNGYLILGAYDNGTLSGLKVTDDLLKKIAAIRSNGNILPIPVMSVDRFQFPEGDLLVAEVSPSDLPPVRYRGRTFIRIGPRRDIATEAEERILAERRMSLFNRGVGQVQTDLKENGNLPAEFNVNLITAFKVDVKVSQSYTNENSGKTGGKVGGDVPSLSQALSLVLSPVERSAVEEDGVCN